MAKIKLDVLKPWITSRVAEILGLEDDVVVEFIFNQLEDDRNPDPRKMQINLTGRKRREESCVCYVQPNSCLVLLFHQWYYDVVKHH